VDVLLHKHDANYANYGLDDVLSKQGQVCTYEAAVTVPIDRKGGRGTVVSKQ
jgi:hypothetical protein